MIENDTELDENEFNMIALKYENLINDVLFEEIPYRYKIQVAESFKDRYVPLQLNEQSVIINALIHLREKLLLVRKIM